MSDLVGNPEDRFAQNEAQLIHVLFFCCPINFAWLDEARLKFTLNLQILSGLVEGINNCLFVWVEALRPSQLFSHVETFSWVEPVLRNEDEVSCSWTPHRAPNEIQTSDLAIKCPALYQMS